MRSRVVFLVGAVMAAVMLVAPPAAVQAGEIKVVGGGVASFDAFPRLVSYWAALATRQDDGATSGEFTCAVVDIGLVLGTFDRSTLNDDGSIKLEGTTAAFFLDGTVAEGVPLSVVVWEGGPKAGRFLFKVPDLPEPGDYETVLFGGIQIKR